MSSAEAFRDHEEHKKRGLSSIETTKAERDWAIRNYDHKFVEQFFNYYNCICSNLSLPPIDELRKMQLMREPISDDHAHTILQHVKALQSALGVKADGKWGPASAAAASLYAKKSSLSVKPPESWLGKHFQQNSYGLSNAEKDAISSNPKISAPSVEVGQGNMSGSTIVRTSSQSFVSELGGVHQTQVIELTVAEHREGPLIAISGALLTLKEFNQQFGTNAKVVKNYGIEFSEKDMVRFATSKAVLEQVYGRIPSDLEVFHFMGGLARLEQTGVKDQKAMEMMVMLNKRFGITHFSRYSGDSLLKQYSSVDWSTGALKIDPSKEQVLYFGNQYDHNGAYLQHGKMAVDPLTYAGKQVFIYEGEEEKQFFSACNEMNKSVPRKYDVIIAGHGSSSGIWLGDRNRIGERAELDLTDTQFSTLNGHTGKIVLAACSTGALTDKYGGVVEDNIAHHLATRTGATVHAPPGASYGIIITRGDEGVSYVFPLSPQKGERASGKAGGGGLSYGTMTYYPSGAVVSFTPEGTEYYENFSQLLSSLRGSEIQSTRLQDESWPV
ncbi:MAG: hypothetical protein N3H30_01205 [Candidatus Micrarchaeota archaeon]|nr:hypothetical protein [Candidatus Micrarchaeota archaeon]